MLKLFLTFTLLAVMCLPALALSPEEVIRLKEAGVSDSLIQTMIENNSGAIDGSGIRETDKYIIYQAAPIERSRQYNYDHERWKEERSMDAVGNVIIDGRRPLPATTTPGQ